MQTNGHKLGLGCPTTCLEILTNGSLRMKCKLFYSSNLLELPELKMVSMTLGTLVTTDVTDEHSDMYSIVT
jgi:hypothetical protein